jgi:hypothetical protein
MQEYPRLRPPHRYSHCHLITNPINPTVSDVTTDVFGQEEQASLYLTAPTCNVKQWTSCVVYFDFFNTSTIFYKQVNLVEVAEKMKCDNNNDNSDLSG